MARSRAREVSARVRVAVSGAVGRGVVYVPHGESALNLETFAEIVRSRLHESGLSASGAALKAGLPRDDIRSVLRGHPPTITRAAEISDALGLEFYVGPPRPKDNSAKRGYHPKWTDRFRSDLRAGIRVDPSSLLHEHHHRMAQRFDEQEEMVRRHGDSPDPKKWVILTAVGRNGPWSDLRPATGNLRRAPWGLARQARDERELRRDRVGGKALDPPLPYPASTVLVDREARKLVGGRVPVDDGGSPAHAARGLGARSVGHADGWHSRRRNPALAGGR